MLVVSHALTFTLRIFFATWSLSFSTPSRLSSTDSLFASRFRNLVCRPTGPLSFVFCKSQKNDYLYDNEVAIGGKWANDNDSAQLQAWTIRQNF